MKLRTKTQKKLMTNMRHSVMTEHQPPEKRRSKPVYTGRGVTLNMLMNEHLIEPGELCMSIEYLVSSVL